MSKVRWALRRLGETSRSQKKLLLQAMGLLPLVHALQQRLSFRTWTALLGRTPNGDVAELRAARAAVPSVEDIAWSVEVARKWLPGTYLCLPVAYTVHLLLKRYGYASLVHVGVRRDDQGHVDAHAWVTSQGQIVVGALPNLASFVELPTLEGSRK